MDQDERDFIRRGTKLLEEWENTPRELDDIYSDMTREEIIRLAMYQRDMLASSEQKLKQREADMSALYAKIDSLIDQLKQSNDIAMRATAKMAEKDDEIRRLSALVQSLTDQLKLGNKQRFGKRSQKGSTTSANKESKSRQQDKDDFDGTPGSLDDAQTIGLGVNND